MGRTIPLYRIMLEEELRRWQRFQDVLCIDEHAIFEDMMDECRRCSSVVEAGAFPAKTEGMFPSFLFAHHKVVKELQDKIGRINSLIEKADIEEC